MNTQRPPSLTILPKTAPSQDWRDGWKMAVDVTKERMDAHSDPMTRADFETILFRMSDEYEP